MRKWIRLICSCGGTVIAVNHKAKKMLKHKEDYPLIDRINYLKKIATAAFVFALLSQEKRISPKVKSSTSETTLP